MWRTSARGRRQAGRRGRARRQRRELRRDRAAAPSAARARFLELDAPAGQGRPRACSWWPRSARRCSCCRNSSAAARRARPTPRSSPAPGRPRAGDRPGPAQDAGRRRRAPRSRRRRRHADGRRSISLVSVAAAWPDFTLLDVTIKTGRTHQIRVHLAHEGHPIVGDPKYGDFALNRSLARGEPSAAGASAHVPARAAARVRASLQRTGDRARGTVAVRIRVPAGRPRPRRDRLTPDPLRSDHRLAARRRRRVHRQPLLAGPRLALRRRNRGAGVELAASCRCRSRTRPASIPKGLRRLARELPPAVVPVARGRAGMARRRLRRCGQRRARARRAGASSR